MPTREELIAEIERRQLLASTGGAATPTPESLAGPSAAPAQSGWQSREDRVAQRGGGEGEWHDAPRAALRGMTMGASDAIGSAVAALPAGLAKGWSGEGPGFEEVYDDIRETTQYQEDQYADRSPEVKNLLEAGGAVSTIAASGLPRATAGALQRGAARVGAKGVKPVVKPRVRGTTAELSAAGQAAPKVSRLKEAAHGAGEGAALDAGQLVFGGDVNPDMTAAGAGLGFVFPRSARKVWEGAKRFAKHATDTPAARMATSRVAGKVVGQKAKPWAYTLSHPATVDKAKGLLKARAASKAFKAKAKAKGLTRKKGEALEDFVRRVEDGT